MLFLKPTWSFHNQFNRRGMISYVLEKRSNQPSPPPPAEGDEKGYIFKMFENRSHVFNHLWKDPELVSKKCCDHSATPQSVVCLKHRKIHEKLSWRGIIEEGSWTRDHGGKNNQWEIMEEKSQKSKGKLWKGNHGRRIHGGEEMEDKSLRSAAWQ